jgi:hypothetical protein
MEQSERNRITSNLVQRRKLIASSYQRNAPVTLDRDTMLDLLALVVDPRARPASDVAGAEGTYRSHTSTAPTKTATIRISAPMSAIMHPRRPAGVGDHRPAMP